MAIEIPSFENKKDLFDFLTTNKSKLIAQKTFQDKRADSVCHFVGLVSDKDGSVVKADNSVSVEDYTKLKVRLVINTTKLMDSHYDVHIDGLWKKSLKETMGLFLLQEHSMTFKGIISDEVKGKTEKISWKELGYKFEGDTECLIFEAEIEKDRNPYMFEQYAKGRVKNHSVGMRYVKIVMCVNNEAYGAEFEAWEKYYPMVANKEQADNIGWFWAVTEAKAVEGSAVPLGSNFATPTLSVEAKEDIEPVNSTQKQKPVNSTSNAKSFFTNLV